MEILCAKNIYCIFILFTLLAVIISTATAITTDHEADENSLNSNLNEDEETEFESSHLPSYYTLRLNPKYYGALQHLLNKRLKGSEFLDADRTSFSDTYGSQNTKRYSEFLGGPGKRLSEFLGGPGKKRFGPEASPSFFLAKKLSEYINSSYKRPARLVHRFYDFYSPKGSEFLGGPGK